MATATASDPLFSALLRPHRSSNLRVMSGLVIAFAVLAFLIGLGFVLAGAWPVTGFLGLDLVLLYAALRFNHGTGRLFEAIELTPERLTIGRSDPWGRRWERRLDPRGTMVIIADAPGEPDRIEIHADGDCIVIGHFLPRDQRRAFARALRQALARVPGAGVSPVLQPSPGCGPCAPCAPAPVC